MAHRERYLVGLDVGTSKVAAIVGEIMDDGNLDIIGIGLAESKGIRRGVVNNVDSAAEAIKKAVDEAELTAGVEIDSVYLALSGAHVKAFNSRGVVASPAAIAKSHGRTSSAPSTPPGLWRCQAAAKSCTSCPRISWSMTRTASPCRSA